jgi:tetratricopeptide (TPR) repeat protein
MRTRLAAEGGRPMAITARQAIHGLGGVGKTQLAIEFAWRAAEHYEALLFVTADSPESLQRNLAGLCGPLVLDLADQQEADESARMEAALRWLGQHPGWFLILDNVDTPEAAAAVERVLNRLTQGHVVITSRLANWSAAVERLELDVLDHEVAAEFLLERTDGGRRKTEDDPRIAREIARDVDGLALALEQAGALVSTRNWSLAEYVRHWQTNRDRVLGWFDERVMRYPRSVAVTWQTSVDQVGDTARGLLRLAAQLAPEPIPGFFFMSERAVVALRKYWPTGEAGSGQLDEWGVEEALAELMRFSLADIFGTGGERAYKVHRLLQETTCAHLGEDLRSAWRATGLNVAEAVAFSDPSEVRNWSVWRPMEPHLEKLVGDGVPPRAAQAAAAVTNHLAMFQQCLGKWASAERFYRDSLQAHKILYGEERSEIATLLNNLAELLRATNRLAEAEPLYRQALTIEEAVLGREHPNVAITLNNLANLLETTNRLSEAEQLYRQALAISEASYGPDHSTVAIRLNNLAGLLRATNRMAEAEPLHRRALAIHEAIYGPDHPHVAVTLNNLAGLLAASNRLSEAESLYRRALVIAEANFGSDHPHVAKILDNLASVLLETHGVAAAEPICRRALAIAEASYGPDHPQVAMCLDNLAGILAVSNGEAEAELLYRRALGIDEASYGSDHPIVANRLNNLALLLLSSGRCEEAEPLYHRAVTIFAKFERATGHESPDFRGVIQDYRMALTGMGLTKAEIEARIREACEKGR